MVISHHQSPNNMTQIKYIGDNTRLRIAENAESLLIIGNNIEVNIGNHRGALKIIGSYCKVRISSGNGNISHIGNNGKFDFVSPETYQNFDYNGNNISITIAGKKVECEENKVEVEKTVNFENGVINISNSKYLNSNS
ncbi:hypothetical protein HHI36_003844 [Cryptolaemus montrouzieri]|uniref:Adhesin domain-containing protein n=1 Tax=Cryptolaemus montrouzieri TaxID=559131 RepID=A0ABD2NQ19_9CUCU